MAGTRRWLRQTRWQWLRFVGNGHPGPGQLVSCASGSEGERRQQLAELGCLSLVARRWVVAGAGLPMNVRHFGMTGRPVGCLARDLTGSWSCCRAGQGVITISRGYPLLTGRMGWPGGLVAVLIGTTLFSAAA